MKTRIKKMVNRGEWIELRKGFSFSFFLNFLLKERDLTCVSLVYVYAKGKLFMKKERLG